MPSRPMRVLVADDEPHIRQLIGRIVAALGGEVVAEAADGEAAVKLFGETAPDIVILDINMPRLTGDKALARIMARSPRAIAVMMTAQDTIDSVRACLDLGARDYLLKSNSAEEIFRMLEASWPLYAKVAEARAA